MTTGQKFLKRSFDILTSFIGLVIFFPFIFLIAFVAFLDTKANGFYSDFRIGRKGKAFRMYKIRSMRKSPHFPPTSITTSTDSRITPFGRFLRTTKMDELPQLWNVLIGDMSFVGPRPDVPGFSDKLQGEDRIILSIRPGITGSASLAFRNEERLLAQQPDPEKYNREIIWPEKIRLNKAYIQNYSFGRDMKIIWDTIFFVDKKN